MLTRKMVFLALAMLFVIAAGTAYSEEPVAKGLSLYLGAYRPTSSSTRDNLGSTWLDIGLGHKLPQSLVKGWDNELAVGYIKAKGETFATEGGNFKTKARIIPLTYTLRSKPAEGSSMRFYYGGGVGAYFTKVEKLNSAGVPSATAGDESKTKFGFQLLVGADVAKNIGVELGYTGISKIRGTKLSGMSLSLVGHF